MRVYQQLFNHIIGWFYVLCTGCIRLKDDSLGWAVIVNILEKVSDAPQRNKLIVVLIYHHRPDAAAILHRCSDIWWKRSHVRVPAMRARLDLCLMFRYFDFYGRNVENLPFYVILRFDIGECCAAQVALLDFMQFDVIRLFHRFQCVANMPLLPAILFVARLSPAFGAGLLETIAGRGFATVFAVLVRA